MKWKHNMMLQCIRTHAAEPLLNKSSGCQIHIDMLHEASVLCACPGSSNILLLRYGMPPCFCAVQC